MNPSTNAVLTAVAATLAAVFIVVVIVASVRQHKRTQAQRLAVARELGLTLNDKPTKQDKFDAFERLEHLKRTLSGGWKNVRRIATAEHRGIPVQMLMHTYTTSNGKNTSTITHTVVTTPCPPAWPQLGIGREHLGHRILEAFGGAKDLQVEDNVFNETFRIRTDDEVFATLALSPAVQAFLLEITKRGPGATSGKKQTIRLSREQWSIAHGGLTLLIAGRVKPDEIEHLLDRVVTFRALLPRELDAYTPNETA